MAATPTPKPKSGAFNSLYKQLCAEFDAPTLVILLFSVLERKRLEAAYNKFSRRDSPRSQMLGKEELVGALGGWFFSFKEVAHAVVRDMDRAAKKERHIVASFPDNKVRERVERYQAIDLRQERAKLTWALLRDSRPEAHKVAAELIAEMVAATNEDQRVRQAVQGGGHEKDRDNAMRQRLETYESMVFETQGKLRGLEGQLATLERERAELIVTIGRKENALRAEEQLRRGAEEAVNKSEQRIREMQEQLDAADPEVVLRLANERSQLERRLRRLEKKGQDKLEVERLREANQQLLEENESLHHDQHRSRVERQGLLQNLAVRDRATHERMERLRGALKTARRLVHQPKGNEESLGNDEDRIGLFVDAANLSASALRAHGGTFDFSKVLDLVGKRKRVMAIAYAVDNGQDGFIAFAGALRDMGYVVKVKKPAKRPDGTVKADWDMAIAMDIIDARQRLDTVLIASGDGDFVPLARRLKRWRKRVEVSAFEHAMHPELRRTADSFWLLE